MLKIPEEKRIYPRIKTNLKVDISKNIFGNSIDLSENGLSFTAEEIISSPVIHIQFQLPGLATKFTTEAKLVWKRNLEEGNSLYGVEFVDLNETKKELLRKELIKTQISSLLNGINDLKIKEQISQFFLKDVSEYITDLINLSNLASVSKGGDVEAHQKLIKLTNEIVLRGYYLEEYVKNKIVMNRVKENFRFLVGTWAYKSKIVKRAFEKPRGYPGDYRMIEDVYSNQPYSRGIGRCYDVHFLNNPYAIAVRYRKDMLRELLHKFINENSKKTSIKILNLACGSCREIAELIPTIKYKNPLNFTCIDWDEEALDFSRDLFKKLPLNIKVELLKEDLLTMIKDQKYAKNLGMHDLIYSIGLIDYLPDRVLKKWIQFFYQLLPKSGKFIVTHKNREKTFPPLAPDWFCDWKFVPRDKNEVVTLLNDCGLGKFKLDIGVDDFTFIYYFTLTKG